MLYYIDNMVMEIDTVDNIYIDKILDNNISILEIHDEDGYLNKVDVANVLEVEAAWLQFITQTMRIT